MRILSCRTHSPEQRFPTTIKDLPWWGLPCAVTPCFGARLVQEGNRLHYLADRAGIRGRFSNADAYHLDQAFPLLMKQLELMLTSGELNPRHQHTVTLYAKGLTCDADTLGSCGYVYLAVYPDDRNGKVTLRNSLLLRPGAFSTPLFHFLYLHIRKIFSMKTLPDTHVRAASRCPSPVTIWQTLLTQLLDQHYGLTLNDTPFADERVIEQHIEAGISLCDAVNFLVEKYALVRTDQPGFSARSPRRS